MAKILDYVKKRNKAVPFIMFSCFIFSFMIARIFVILNPTTWITFKDYHIHHFFFGTILILFGGFLGLNYSNKKVVYLGSMFYGIGLGLFADEIGLLITWEDYWSNITYDAVIFLSSFFLMFLFLKDFLTIFGSRIKKTFGKQTYNFIKNINKITLDKEKFLISYIGFIILVGLLLFFRFPEHIHSWILIVSISLLCTIFFWLLFKIMERKKRNKK